MDDSKYYAQVLAEIQSGRVDPGLKAKAFAEGLGDARVGEALYMKLRVEQIKSEGRQEFLRSVSVRAGRGVGMLIVYVICIAIVTSIFAVECLYLDGPLKVGLILAQGACGLVAGAIGAQKGRFVAGLLAGMILGPIGILGAILDAGDAAKQKRLNHVNYPARGGGKLGAG